MTARALEVLKQVDFIAAEDTRKSGVLLKHFEIKKPLVSYFEHNKAERGRMIVSRLLEGQTCALVTDAGMPAISDPGEDLVRQCYENGLTVSALPGPCAVVTALAMSGLPTGRFCFEGFLSTAQNSRREHLAALETEKRTMIFYEAPHKLRDTLLALRLHFGGGRRISLIREISKIYEEAVLTTLDGAVGLYEQKEPKGEFVLVVEGLSGQMHNAVTDEELEKLFFEKLACGLSRAQAAKELAREYNVPRRMIYDRFKE